VRLHRGALGRADEALELAVAYALLRGEAARGDATVRIRRPAMPAVVFGRRDTRLPGFPAAVLAAREHGFTPLVRATGGRAVAYDDAALVVDHVSADPDPRAGHDRRFREFGTRMARIFRNLGIDARLGAVPGEYCPGAFSVNARGTAKLVGTSQRIVRNAWLFSSLVVVGGEHRLRPVLAEVYTHLGQPFDPASVGSLTSELASLDTGIVERALLADYQAAGGPDPEPLDPQPLAEPVLALARELAGQYRIPDPAGITGSGAIADSE
jgi:lipoate-protein ligase A